MAKQVMKFTAEDLVIGSNVGQMLIECLPMNKMAECFDAIFTRPNGQVVWLKRDGAMLASLSNDHSHEVQRGDIGLSVTPPAATTFMTHVMMDGVECLRVGQGGGLQLWVGGDEMFWYATSWLWDADKKSWDCRGESMVLRVWKLECEKEDARRACDVLRTDLEGERHARREALNMLKKSQQEYRTLKTALELAMAGESRIPELSELRREIAAGGGTDGFANLDCGDLRRWAALLNRVAVEVTQLQKDVDTTRAAYLASQRDRQELGAAKMGLHARIESMEKELAGVRHTMSEAQKREAEVRLLLTQRVRERDEARKANQHFVDKSDADAARAEDAERNHKTASTLLTEAREAQQKAEAAYREQLNINNALEWESAARAIRSGELRRENADLRRAAAADVNRADKALQEVDAVLTHYRRSAGSRDAGAKET